MANTKNELDLTERIIHDIFLALDTENLRSIQDISYTTRHTWPVIKKYLKLIQEIQAKPQIVEVAGKYKTRLKKGKITD